MPEHAGSVGSPRDHRSDGSLFGSVVQTGAVEELDKFHGTGLPARRPNSMNNYGIVVNEIGMEPALDQLCHNLLQPLAHYLFPGGFK